MRRMLGMVALTLALVAVSAGGALADGGAPGGKGPFAGLLGGPAASGAGAPVFTCAGAGKRLARLNHAIAIAETRIANGTAKNAELTTKLVERAKGRAAKIKARIAENCS